MEEVTINPKFDNISPNRYGVYAICLILVSTIIQAYFGYARDANAAFKLIIAGLCWAAITFSILKAKKCNELSTYGSAFIWLFSASIVWSGIKALIWSEVYAGDKLNVLFGNMYTMLDLVGVFFIWSVQNGNELRMLKKATYIMINISLILLIFNYDVTIESYFLTYICTFAPIFIPYISLKQKALILFGISLSIFCYYGGGRQAALILIIALCAVTLSYFYSKKTTLIASIIICILPFFLIYISLTRGSIFEFFQDEVTIDSTLEIKNEDTQSDTRTFLWAEMSYDFMNQNIMTQVTGKGAIAYYHSYFFQTNNRLGIEVPVLQWILQAGYFYFILFTIIVLYAIIRLYRYGNNQLCNIASILISGYYCNCFVSNLVGCNLMHLGVWGMIGIAFSKTIMQYTDDELYCEINDIDYYDEFLISEEVDESDDNE